MGEAFHQSANRPFYFQHADASVSQRRRSGLHREGNRGIETSEPYLLPIPKESGCRQQMSTTCSLIREYIILSTATRQKKATITVVAFFFNNRDPTILPYRPAFIKHIFISLEAFFSQEQNACSDRSAIPPQYDRNISPTRNLPAILSQNIPAQPLRSQVPSSAVREY